MDLSEMQAQAGLHYAQTDALIRSLLLDETFSALSLAERTAVQQRIKSRRKARYFPIHRTVG